MKVKYGKVWKYNLSFVYCHGYWKNILNEFPITFHTGIRTPERENIWTEPQLSPYRYWILWIGPLRFQISGRDKVTMELEEAIAELKSKQK